MESQLRKKNTTIYVNTATDALVIRLPEDPVVLYHHPDWPSWREEFAKGLPWLEGQFRSAFFHHSYSGPETVIVMQAEDSGNEVWETTALKRLAEVYYVDGDLGNIVDKFRGWHILYYS